MELIEYLSKQFPGHTFTVIELEPQGDENKKNGLVIDSEPVRIQWSALSNDPFKIDSSNLFYTMIAEEVDKVLKLKETK